MEHDIIIVSGLPRSGTSLMMQMLEKGGVPVVIDHVRTPDTDNPKGYHEFEKVKQIKQDVSWLPATRGKAFKMVSQLLYDLPASEKYRVIFMLRDLDEMLVSQEKMLKRLNRPAAPAGEIKPSFVAHLDRLRDWLRQQQNIQVLYVNYKDLIERPSEEAERITGFLAGAADAQAMAQAVDPTLYRNRKAEPSGE